VFVCRSRFEERADENGVEEKDRRVEFFERPQCLKLNGLMDYSTVFFEDIECVRTIISNACAKSATRFAWRGAFWMGNGLRF